MADPARALPPTQEPEDPNPYPHPHEPPPPVRRDLLRQRQAEAKTTPAPEELAPTIERVKRLVALKQRIEPAGAPVGSPLHPRTADLVAKKGRVLVNSPRPHKPLLGLATIADRAALGGRMRGSKTCKTPEARAELLSRIGKKGGFAKARKRRAMLRAIDRLDRQIARDRKKLLKAGVPASILE